MLVCRNIRYSIIWYEIHVPFYERKKLDTIRHQLKKYIVILKEEPMVYFITVITISMSISALCSILEACLLSMSHSDVADISSKNPRMHKIWNNFKGNIQKPIAVILIVNTFAHTIGASLSGAQFDKVFGPQWIVLFSVIFSFVMIQWTEILPKTLGVKYNKKIALVGSVPLLLLIKLFTPFIKLIEFLNKPFIGKTNVSLNIDAVNEISVLSNYAFINNLISKDQQQIISRTVRLTKKKVKDIMVPKNEIKTLNDQMTMMEALIAAHIHNHTRYPFIKNSNPNEIIGYINFKDIVSVLQINPVDPSLKSISRPLISFNEDDNFSFLFKRFTKSHQHIAIVKNKKDEITGLVTLEDVIEEIIGEIEDEYDELPIYFYPITNTRYIIGGGVTVKELNEKLSVELIDADLSINEWIKKQYGSTQKSGNKYYYSGITFIIKKITRSKIGELIIEKNTPVS